MLFSVSVDLDGLSCYAAIHGLPGSILDEAALRVVPEVALTRLCEMFADEGVRATFFAIGRELELPYAAASLRRAAEAGHEIASHSHSHDYSLSRRSAAEIDADLAAAERAIEAAAGGRPRGFRAPGYTLSPPLLGALRARGYLYDSSLLPSPPYYAAKAAALLLHVISGRRSQSILGGAGQLFAARAPHLRLGVRELPIATIPLLRAPVIGTVALAIRDRAAVALAWASAAGGHLNFSLHGLDALDATDGVPRALASLQPGLALPAAVKLRRLRTLLRRIKERAEVRTLEEAALALLPVDPLAPRR